MKKKNRSIIQIEERCQVYPKWTADSGSCGMNGIGCFVDFENIIITVVAIVDVDVLVKRNRNRES